MIPIHLRNIPPPIETFDHIKFLAFIASYIKPQRYLELGVRDGRTFKEVSKISLEANAVDVCECEFELKPNMKYHQMTTDEYFKTLKLGDQFDMIFIDADHSHEQSLKDFMNASRFLINDGFIFFHDTYPYNESMFAHNLCNDAYKTPLYIKENLIDFFEIITLPFNPGVTMVKKIHRTKQLIYLND